MTDIVVVGGGIVALAVARSLIRFNPHLLINVIEKEPTWSAQVADQSGAIIHSGVGYQPGSIKARLARAGNERLIRFCCDHGIPHEVCGKVVVATDEDEVTRLNRLYERGLANGVSVKRMSLAELRDREPHVRGMAALHVPTTGIVDFVKVADKLADLALQSGVELHLATRLESIERTPGEIRLGTTKGVFSTRFLINCAGLYSDRVAEAELDIAERQRPARGGYFQLRADRAHLVRHLVFPVPDSHFPFAGPHLTRSVHGGVIVGPSYAMVSPQEPPAPRAHNFSEAKQALRAEELWGSAQRQAKRGLAEPNSGSQLNAFTRRLQRLIPELTTEDFVPSTSGARGPAFNSEKDLTDDFQVMAGRNSLHICHASSPSATLALELGHYVACQAAQSADFPTSVGGAEDWMESAEHYCAGICEV